MRATENVINDRNNIILDSYQNTCLVTSQQILMEGLRANLSNTNLRIKNRLADLIGERDCNMYIIDTKVPDINIWPAPLLMNPNAPSNKRWLFLMSEIADAHILSFLPCNSMVLDQNVPIHELVALVNKRIDPKYSKQIADLHYIENVNAFIIRMENGKSYLLKVDELNEADSSRITKWTIGKNGHYFRFKQESGNWIDVPWDAILYHCEPEYEYYKDKQLQQVDQDYAKRIGDRVRKLRMAKGLSIEKLAQIAQMKRPNLSRLEHGRHSPSLETLERVAEALDVPVVDIIARNASIKQ